MSGKGELSSRVMNMKFMKFMKTDEEKKEEDTAPVLKHDDSRWDMKSIDASQSKSSKKLIVRRKQVQAPVEQNVSITTMENEGKVVKKNALHGRRVFGVNPNKRPAEEETNVEDKRESEDGYNPEEQDMDTLLKKSKNKKPQNKPKVKKHKKK